MQKIIKFFFWILSPLGIISYGRVLFNHLSADLFHSDPFRMAFYGFLIGSLFWVIFKNYLRFFRIFTHELTHLFFGLLFFKKPKMILATNRAGKVALSGSNFLILLSPYFFPLYSFVLLIVSPLLKPSIENYFCAVLGFSTGYHIVSHIQGFANYQSDIRESGLIFSILFCTFGNIAALGYILSFLTGGFPEGWSFCVKGLNNAGSVLRFLAEKSSPFFESL